MPGEKSYGFHEGSRSEYLAQYAFASWGTTVVIPQQEDHGLDLHCTLMQQVGGRLLANYPYTVQVKSQMKPVVFEGKEAVRWVIEHPLPLFLCIVDKASARISVYHTLARFHAWSLGKWPDRLSMIPEPATPGKKGRCAQWPGCYDLSLDQPILDFSINEMLDESYWQKAREVFEHWVEVENDNLTRVRNRLLTCRVPDPYKTNDTWVGGWATLSLGFPNEAQFDQTTAGLKESVAWIGEQLLRKGDLDGAAKAALLHRHLFPNEHGGLLNFVQPVLNGCLGKNGYVYAGVDHLAEMVQKTLKGIADAEPDAPAVHPRE
jgi:hypothetical protein